MPIWLRKMLVVLITIFTFGLVSPSAILLPNDEKANPESSILDKNNQDESDQIQDYSQKIATEIPIHKETPDIDSLSWNEVSTLIPVEDLETYFVEYAVNQANKQSFEKFGPRISEKIGNQYREEILPSFEEAMLDITQTMDKDSYHYLAFSEKVPGGNTEKIFHILDKRNGQDLFRFHVRREHPPQEGYWFSFHYHIADDDYDQHHELGKIYWDTNTPPKWMA